MPEFNRILMIAYSNYETDSRVIREAESAYQAGFEVDVIVLKLKESKRFEKINHISIYRLNQIQYTGRKKFPYIFSYFQFMFRVFIKLIFLYSKRKYQIVHINNMPNSLVFAAIIPKLLGSKIILDIHDPMANTFRTKFKVNKNNWIYRFLLFEEKISAGFADHVITVNDPVKNDILVKEGIPGNKITVIHNYADENVFKLIDDYHIHGKIRIIFYGTIAERFGFKTILQALKEMPQKDSLYFMIIGEGEYAPDLKSLIAESGLNLIVNFDNRTYPVKVLPDILKTYHLGLVSYDLSPATEYMLPVKMMELFLMGIPVITIGNKAITHHFDKNQYFSYDPRDRSSLINLLTEIRNNPDHIMTKRQNILEIKEHYKWSKESKIYQQLLLKLSRDTEYDQN